MTGVTCLACHGRKVIYAAGSNTPRTCPHCDGSGWRSAAEEWMDETDIELAQLRHALVGRDDARQIAGKAPPCDERALMAAQVAGEGFDAATCNHLAQMVKQVRPGFWAWACVNCGAAGVPVEDRADLGGYDGNGSPA